MLAGSQNDRVAAPAREICGLFMKTRRGGSRRRAKQTPVDQWEATGEVENVGQPIRFDFPRAVYGHQIDGWFSLHMLSVGHLVIKHG